MVSISRNLKKYIIEEMKEIQSINTGAITTTWEQVGYINIAIFENTEKITIDKIRKQVINYKGYTKNKTLKANTTRITDLTGNNKYLITNIKPSVWNNLDLEKVEAF